MAFIPPTRYSLEKLPLHFGTLSEDIKDSFATEEEWEKAKEEIDLWRLSRDLIRARREGWGQSRGKVVDIGEMYGE